MIILGVSGGVDSMVLLDMMYQKNYKIIIAHVNYNKREDSYLDIECINNYIKDKDIILEVLNVSEYDNSNFQAQARHLRYNFYMSMADKYHTKEIYLAHHYDDFLETYLFKKQRKGLYDYYGLKEVEVFQEKYYIKRILLDYTKQQIINYALTNDIKFHEDYTNHELNYTRNQIRASLLNKSLYEKNLIYQEALILNQQIILEKTLVNKLNKIIIKCSDFNLLPNTIKRRYLFSLINKYTITQAYLDEISGVLINSPKACFVFDKLKIYKSMNLIFFLDQDFKTINYHLTSNDDLLKLNEDLKTYGISIKEQYLSYPCQISSITNENINTLFGSLLTYKKKLKKIKVPTFIKDNMLIVNNNQEIKLYTDYIYLLDNNMIQ